MSRTGASLAVVLSFAAGCGGVDHVTVPAPFITPPVVANQEPHVPPPPPPPLTQTATPQDLVFPDEAFRAQQPEPGPARPLALPKVHTFKLKNGIQVYLIEQHTLPLVSIDLNFDGGALLDPPGKEGLASVCMAMLTEGTTRLDKIAYSEALADVASSISAYAGDDTQGVALDSLSEHWDATLAVFAETVRSPGLRRDDFERMIKRRIEAVKQSKGSAASIASRVGSPVVYGHGTPAGALTTEASLAAITLDDCKDYAARWLHPHGARLFVVGDLTAAQIHAAFEGAAFVGWKGTDPSPPAPAKPAPMAGRVFFVDVPGAAQSQVTLYHQGPARTARDYLANTLMSAILGGGFTSRINMNLREGKGYTYGARGGLSYTRTSGVLSAGAPVRSDATYQSILELHRELVDLQSGARPAAPDEVEREKASAILGLPGRFATGSASLSMYRTLVYYGLPLDYYATFTDQMSRVTVADVVASAAHHIAPDEARYVVVGDGAALMVVRDPASGKDVPLMADGHQLTLREALASLVAHGDLGAGGLVELDADAVVK